MLLSCTVTRGIWRFQPLIFDDTEHTACSAMTSPYRQGANSYIVHFHSLFQAFKTIIELDITYSLLKIFYQHIAIHGEHYLRARCWCSWPSQTLSATSRNIAQEENLNFWKTGATSLIGIAGYDLWVLRSGRDASLTLLGESGFVCLSRESLKIGKRPRNRSRTLKVVFNVKATLMSIGWNCPRRAVPSELKNRDPYEKEAGTRSLLLT